ncbi:PfkB family carbohydrate kinase [Enterococcus cecorum]
MLGDAFSGAFIDSWLNGETLADCLKFATTNAVFTIRCMHTVRTDLTKEKLIQNREELAL